MSALVTTLEVQGAASATNGVTLRLTVSNPSKTRQRFIRYNTPFEGVRNDFVAVIDDDGKAIEYRGIMAKRTPPTAEDEERVGPGESKRATFDLREGYAVVAGRYTVHFVGGAVSRLPDSPPITITVEP